MRPRLPTAALCAALLSLLAGAPAHGAVSHTVTPGESLWSIAQANGLTPATLASFNDLSADAQVIIGTRLKIPTAADGVEQALPPGYVAIHHPSERPALRADAAHAWEAMRQESLRKLGVDLYPVGALSGYRTYAQQAHLYRLYQRGKGNPANPPGSSSHETGTSVDVPAPEMREAIDQIGGRFGWRKVEAPSEWWHVSYVGGY